MTPRKSAIKTDLFAADFHQQKLDQLGDPLLRIASCIDFPALAAEVDRVAPRPTSPQGGRPPYPTETMVRILVLKRLYNLSDEQMEYQLLDRHSYQRFCGLVDAARLPDRTTIWHFGDFMVAPLLAFGQWVVAAAFPLDTTPVALGLELFFPLLTGVASIRIHFRTGIPVIQYNFKVPAVVDRGSVGHQLADQFVFAIYSDRELEAIGAFAMLLRPGRIQIIDATLVPAVPPPVPVRLACW